MLLLACAACALVSCALFGWAVTSPWVPFGQVPTPEMVDQAHHRVLLAGAAGVGLPLLGAALAFRWRRDGYALLFVFLSLGSLFVSRLLWGFAD